MQGLEKARRSWVPTAIDFCKFAGISEREEDSVVLQYVVHEMSARVVIADKIPPYAAVGSMTEICPRRGSIVAPRLVFCFAQAAVIERFDFTQNSVDMYAPRMFHMMPFGYLDSEVCVYTKLSTAALHPSMQRVQN